MQQIAFDCVITFKIQKFNDCRVPKNIKSYPQSTPNNKTINTFLYSKKGGSNKTPQLIPNKRSIIQKNTNKGSIADKNNNKYRKRPPSVSKNTMMQNIENMNRINFDEQDYNENELQPPIIQFTNNQEVKIQQIDNIMNESINSFQENKRVNSFQENKRINRLQENKRINMRQQYRENKKQRQNKINRQYLREMALKQAQRLKYQSNIVIPIMKNGKQQLIPINKLTQKQILQYGEYQKQIELLRQKEQMKNKIKKHQDQIQSKNIHTENSKRRNTVHPTGWNSIQNVTKTHSDTQQYLNQQFQTLSLSQSLKKPTHVANTIKEDQDQYYNQQFDSYSQNMGQSRNTLNSAKDQNILNESNDQNILNLTFDKNSSYNTDHFQSLSLSKK